MEIRPIENGIAVSPETDFEQDYLRRLFTNNMNRTVVFNHETGNLRVTIRGTGEADKEKQ